jgi:PIN domain nuclease of toxin-antitoxin system
VSDVVLDASAILAVILREPGADKFSRLVTGGLVSAVNVSEVVARLSDWGASEPEIRGFLNGLELISVPFDSGDAWATGLLRRRTRHEKLSLGDRACLALAISRGLPALTTDTAWGRLGLGKTVRVVG